MVRQKIQAQMISNMMMKGLDQSGKYAKDSTEQDRLQFLEKYEPVIYEIMPLLPRGSAAIGAAVCKCAIKFGMEKTKKFAKSLKEGVFNGQDDPVHLLWAYTMRNSDETPGKLYKLTLTACIAYCEGRQIKSLRPAKRDVFVWNSPDNS